MSVQEPVLPASDLRNELDSLLVSSVRPHVRALPVWETLPLVFEALGIHGRAVLEALPGAGKTTLVPLALLHAPWLAKGKILMLEPRRMAARAAARRMAAMLGEDVGQCVGYRMRMEHKVSRHTRIEVVTEGILTRLLQNDPALTGVGCILFDEFHERSLHGDVGLALALDCQEGLREDLRLLVMSATLDGANLGQWLHCPVVRSEGRVWPVSTIYAPVDSALQGRGPQWTQPMHNNRNWLVHVAQSVCRAMDEQQGNILVFLPGAGEIRSVSALLEAMPQRFVSAHGSCCEDSPPLQSCCVVYPLYGELPTAAQDAAIAPTPTGRRKVVLSTAIAETSLTIEGVNVVIDGGLSRVPRFDPGSGMGRLVTEKVSQAGADQRRGRAGRLGPGVCYRLWNESEQPLLRPFARPEILESDLARLLLETALWGAPDPGALHWLDPPPPEALEQAQTLLYTLDALDSRGRVTVRGQHMAALPLHPRLAHMVLEADSRGLLMEACLLATLAGERDLLPTFSGVDVRLRLSLLSDESSGQTSGLNRLRLFARQLYTRVAGTTSPHFLLSQGLEQCGLLLALAYPDRVAQRRLDNTAQFRLRNGRGAVLSANDPLVRAPFLAVGELEEGEPNVRIRQAAPLTREELDELFGTQYITERCVVWDAREQAVNARVQTRLDALVLENAPLGNPPEAEIQREVLRGLRDMGLHCLPWTESLRQWRARVHFVGLQSTLKHIDFAEHFQREKTLRSDDSLCWPDMTDKGLLENLEVWLEPFLAGVTRRSQFKRLNLENALYSLLSWPMQQELARRAPTHVRVPSGSQVALDYASSFGQNSAGSDREMPGEGPTSEQGAFSGKGGEPPVLAVKLQELFGLTHTPEVDGVPVLVHLLSPAGRPLQVTRDLEGFWKSSYPAVRAEMRGRYPKHPWPEDPFTALPTRFTKKRAGL